MIINFIFDAIYAFENLVVGSLEWIVGFWVFEAYEIAGVFGLYDAAHPSRSFLIGTAILALIVVVSYFVIKLILWYVRKNEYILNIVVYNILLAVTDVIIDLLQKLKAVIEKEEASYASKLERRRRIQQLGARKVPRKYRRR